MYTIYNNNITTTTTTTTIILLLLIIIIIVIIIIVARILCICAQGSDLGAGGRDCVVIVIRLFPPELGIHHRGVQWEGGAVDGG